MDECKNIIKAFVKYGFRGFSYLYWRYVVAPQLLALGRSIERPATRDDFSMHMFVGSRDFLMGMWSLASAYRVFAEIGQLYIHSDGSLTEKHRSIINALFPSARIEDAAQFMEAYGYTLDQYPLLKTFRTTYKKFQIRIIDQHFITRSPIRLFMDSDLLWFKEPRELTEAIRRGVPAPIMLSNSEYIRMEFADGTVTDDAVSRPNGGLVLYRKDQMDLDRMQAFLKKADYVNKRFGDQAWMAWTLRPQLLPEATYIIKGTLTDAIVLRHYTNPQRAKFYFYGINRIAKDILTNHVRN